VNIRWLESTKESIIFNPNKPLPQYQKDLEHTEERICDLVSGLIFFTFHGPSHRPNPFQGPLASSAELVARGKGRDLAKTRQDKTGQDKTGQDNTIQDKTRHNKTR
jgi:hypothetical protein